MRAPYDFTFLSREGITFEEGLTDVEMDQIESDYAFTFPPDLKSFLKDALPISHGFITWRGESKQNLRNRLDWPLEGICFDIEHNDFWLQDWGVRPDTLSNAFEIARARVSVAPTLIPILGHRYIPDRPTESGNPIFSVHQTDIICYGIDLADYLRSEFEHRAAGDAAGRTPKRIEFWTHLVEL